MTHFPGPISLPESVISARAVRLRELVRSASRGVAIRTSIILFELFGVYLFGSSALLMDAISSLIDVVSSLLLILCIKLADRPPDADHPFGHGRYEPLVGLQLGLMLVFIGAVMVFQQIWQVASQVSGEPIHRIAWIIPFIALILLEICYHVVMRTAKKQHSPALAADAAHYRIDSITSLFATIALVIAAFLPEWSRFIDHVGAFTIIVLMVVMGLYAARNNLHQLMDKAPDPSFFEKVRDAASRVSGVLGTEKIRIQQYGPDAHVDIDIEVNPELSVDLAHQISQQVRIEIQKDWPSVRDVTVHIEPFYPGDH